MGADVGIHFFNPVAVLPLVELVRTPDTDDVTLATAWAFAEQLRKRPVLVSDAPAFVVNRVLTRLMASCSMRSSTGTAQTKPTRRSSVSACRWPRRCCSRWSAPASPTTCWRRCTRPTPTAFRSRGRSPTTPRARTRSRSASTRRAQEEILETALEAIADEIRHLLEEGVVAEAKDVDTALLLGAGWPFWLGGITKYLDQTGISEKMFGRPLAEVGAAAPTP